MQQALGSDFQFLENALTPQCFPSLTGLEKQDTVHCTVDGIPIFKKAVFGMPRQPARHSESRVLADANRYR
jgi:hypothetical protein